MEQDHPNSTFSLSLIGHALATHWRRIAVILVITAVVTGVVMLFIPNYYRSNAKYVWNYYESSVAIKLNHMGQLQGFSLNDKHSFNTDAVTPKMYGKLFDDNFFMKDLLATKVTTSDGQTMDYFTYLQDYPQFSLWQKMGGILDGSTENHHLDITKTNPQRLTAEEEIIFQRARKHILWVYNTNTDLVTLSVLDADPQICTAVIDTLQHHIESFTKEYRLSKYTHNAQFLAEETKKARQQYDEAAASYAAYLDSHRGTPTGSVQATIDDLEETMLAAQKSYQAVKAQEEQAWRRSRDLANIFYPFSPAFKAVKHEGPHRAKTILTAMLLVFALLTLWYVRNDIRKQFD